MVTVTRTGNQHLSENPVEERMIGLAVDAAVKACGFFFRREHQLKGRETDRNRR